MGIETETEAVEDRTVERFLDVLQRRPRPGIALDKVYYFHVANHSIEPFLHRLDQSPPEDRAGEKQMIRGLMQMRRGQYGEAIKSLEKAEDWIQRDPMSSYHLAMAFVALGQTEQAVAALKRAVAKEPTRTEAPKTYFELARQLVQLKDTKQAIKIWDQLDERFSGDRIITERIAKEMFAHELYVPAMKRYQELIQSTESQSDRVRFQIEMAEIQRRTGKPQEAATRLFKILSRLRSESWLYLNVRNRLESCLAEGDDFSTLAEFYRDKYQSYPDDTVLAVRFGEILILMKQFDEAQEVLEDVVQRSPSDRAARHATIDMLVQNGRRQETSRHYRELLALDPKNPDILLQWGHTVLNDLDKPPEKRRRDAATIWRRILSNHPQDAIAYVRVARLLESVDSPENTIATYRKAIELAPEKFEYREFLGQYLHGLGRRQEAVETWESIAAPQRRNQDTLVRLAEVFQAFGYLERSANAWRTASRFDLTFDQRVRYARVLRELDSPSQAIEQLELAQEIAGSREEHQRLETLLVEIHQHAGTLDEAIQEVRSRTKTYDNLRFLSTLQLANSNPTEAWIAIEEARTLAPTDREVLRVAAKVALIQERHEDAIRLHRVLADQNPRFRAEHLHEIVALHKWLSQTQAAYRTAHELVKATPQSAEAYRTLADMAFAIGREEEAGAALRVAVECAPQTNSHRLALADHLAKTFHTVEAIDHYWQAMENESNWTSRKTLIKTLLPLYQRRGEVDRLLLRLESFAFQSKDESEARCLIAAYWQSLGFHRRACMIMHQLVAQEPDNPHMLRQLVDCLSGAKQFLSAAEFQVRLVNLTRDPGDIHRLTQLQVQLDKAKVVNLLKQRIRQSGKPKEMLTIIRETAEGDQKLAIELCRTAIGIAPEAWGIQSVLAQLLLFQPGIPSRATLDETKAVALKVLQAKRHSDDRPPSFVNPLNVSPPDLSISPFGGANDTSLTYQIRLANTRKPRPGAVSATYVIPKIEFAKFLRGIFEVAEAPGATPTKPRNRYRRYLAPEDYRQARWVCRAVAVLAQCKLNKTRQDRPSVDQVVDDIVSMQFDSATRDPDELEQLYALHHFRFAMSGKPATVPESLLWRLAEVMPEQKIDPWEELIDERLVKLSVSEVAPPIGMSPLSDEQLQTLVRVCEVREQKGLQWTTKASLVTQRLQLLRSLFLEHQFAKTAPPELNLGIETQAQKTLLLSIVAIQVALWRKDRPAADRLVAELPAIARSDRSSTLVNLLETTRHLTWLFTPKTKIERQFQSQYRLRLIDSWIAHSAARSGFHVQNASPKERIDFYADGMAAPKSVSAAAGSVHPIRWPKATTLSNHLLSEYLLSGLLRLPTSQHPSREMVDPDVITHLETHPSNATPFERKIRNLLIAYAILWNGNPDVCVNRLQTYADAHPDDIDYQVELAAVEVRTGQIDRAIDRLNSFNGIDQESNALIGLAKTHLMLNTGVNSLIYQSAEQSLSQVVPGPFRSALTEQYRKMGLNDRLALQQKTLPRRLQSISGHVQSSIPQQLRYASDALSTGNRILASEIAFSIAQRSLTIEGGNKAIHRRAVEILHRAGRLSNLIESYEREYDVDREKESVRAELTSLYQLDGQHRKAAEIWMEESKTIPTDRLVNRASELNAQHAYDQAAVVYLIAFQRRPSLWDSHWSDFVQTCEAADNSPLIYDQLAQHDLNACSMFSLCNVMQINSSDRFSREQRAFVQKIIQNHPDAILKQSLIERFASVEEREWIRKQFRVREPK